ncbi:MAG: DUF1365 domain-containing protein [Pseudomonadota bacterium]|nr:MAG: DUF1365 domain-containing protein [Pseudomonadota bacterium]
MNSCIYVGQVRHRRFAPRQHAFSYRVFMMYLDLGELPQLFQRYWLWSTQRRNLAWFRRADHLGDASQPLDEAVRDLVAARTGRRPAGPVRLLTQLRYFGYGFNPVSFYYCFDRSGTRVRTVVAEVNNTPWGEQYCYVLDEAENIGAAAYMRYRVQKQFHVSPFMDMDMQYDWRLGTPGERLSVHIANSQDGDKMFDATLNLQRRAIGHGALAGTLTQFPVVTAKVTGAIYFEALRLWLKKVPIFDHPEKREAPHAAKNA